MFNSAKINRRRTGRKSLTFQKLEPRQLLATLVVNSVVDDASGAVDGMVSLREAMIAANTNASFGDAIAGDTDGDVIRFDPAIAGLTYILSEGEISISDDVMIQGGQTGLTLDAQSSSRIFNVVSSETVAIGKLRLTSGLADIGGAILVGGGGTTILNGVSLSGNTATGDGGGAIYVSDGSFFATESMFVGNKASGASGSGGALLQLAGDVAIFNGAMTTNEANRAGGAIEIVDGTFYSRNLQVGGQGQGNVAGPSGSAAPGNGGGLHVTGAASVVVSGGNYTDNVAAKEGGALWNQAGSSMFIFGANIANNVASGAAADDGGGGIFNNGGDLFISNATISGNAATGASGSGGGIFSSAGHVVINHSTLEANVAIRAGGGIELIDGQLDFNDSTLGGDSVEKGNIAGLEQSAAPGNGGGFHVTGMGTNAYFRRSVVANNIAASEGGGLWNQAGSLLRIDDTTIEMNLAGGDDADNGGGGIFNNGGRLTIANQTKIASNLATGASGSGGGIFSTNGRVLIFGSSIENNAAARAGGGVEIVDGFLRVADSMLHGNDAGVTVTAMPGNGGGLHVSGDSARVYFKSTTVSDNIAASEGGGLWNQAGSLLRIDDSSVSANVALGDQADNGGGGIFNNGGRLTVVGSTIDNNLANGASGSGGGLFSTGGEVLMFHTTLDQNAAARAGGGIELIDGFTRLTNTTVSSNDAGVSIAAAPGSGGGLHVSGNANTLELNGSTFIGNIANNQGGGLWNQTGSRFLLLGGNRIANNSSVTGVGGGVYTRGLFESVDSVFQNNMSGADGGGLLITSTGSADIFDSEFLSNAADSGAGIFNAGSLSVMDSVFSDNVASVDGGGIFTDAMGSTTESGNTFSGNLPNNQN